MNLFNHRIEAFFSKYVHFSFKPLVIVFCFFSFAFFGLFMMDSSLFSASLVGNSVYNSSSLVENADRYAGMLPNSPLYSLKNILDKDFQKEDAYVLFAKVIKASRSDTKIAQNLYNNFIQKLNQFSDQEKSEVIHFLISQTKSVSIEEPVFSEVFDLYARENLEAYWVMQLTIYIENHGSYNLAKDRARIIFEELAQKGVPMDYIQEKQMFSDLSFIKKSLESPVIDGETFHATPDDWMETNSVWKSL